MTVKQLFASKLKSIALVIFALVLTFAVGCAKKPAATVNGERITEEMVNKALNEKLAEHGNQGVNVNRDALRKAVIEQLITERLLLQGAKELNISATEDEVNAEIEAMKRAAGEEAFKKGLSERGLTLEELRRKVSESITIAKFIDNLVPKGSVKEEEIKHYYTTSTMPFLKPELVEVRFIQTASEAEAESIIKELRSSKKGFDAFADELEKSKKAIVSAYGWTRVDFYGPEIAAGLKGLQKGAYGGPFKGKDAYYIFRIKDRQPQRPETLDEAREKISNILLERKRQGAVAHWVADRRVKSKVVIN